MVKGLTCVKWTDRDNGKMSCLVQSFSVVMWLLNCIHAEGKTGAEQINTICLGKEKEHRKEKILLLCFILFFLTATPWINVVLAAKLRTDVLNFGTCLTCLFDALYLSFRMGGSSGIFLVSAGGALHWCLHRTKRCCALVLGHLKTCP